MSIDTITVHDLRFIGRHGVFEEERRDGRRFAVDIEVAVPTVEAGRSDELRDTVDYRTLAELALEVGRGPSIHLIERMAQRMSDAVFARFPHVVRVCVELRKFAPDVPGGPRWVGVRIERTGPSGDTGRVGD